MYNLYLHTAQEHYKQTKKHLSGYDFSKWLNNVHTKETDPWIKDVSSKAVKQAIMNGDKAFKNFFKGLAKFPRFKKKRNQDVKAYFPKNNATDLTVERHRIKVPTIGWVRLKEFGYLPNGCVLSKVVRFHKKRVVISSLLLCEVEEVREVYVPEQDGIGIDVGISTFASCSHHVVFENINKTQRVMKLEKQIKATTAETKSQLRTK